MLNAAVLVEEAKGLGCHQTKFSANSVFAAETDTSPGCKFSKSRFQPKFQSKTNCDVNIGICHDAQVLQKPDMEPKKRRGGKRFRKMKERYGLTDTRKAANRVNFNQAEEEFLDGDEVKTQRTLLYRVLLLDFAFSSRSSGAGGCIPMTWTAMKGRSRRATVHSTRSAAGSTAAVPAPLPPPWALSTFPTFNLDKSV